MRVGAGRRRAEGARYKGHAGPRYRGAILNPSRIVASL